jgi:hypothetical protein
MLMHQPLSEAPVQDLISVKAKQLQKQPHKRDEE